MGVAAADEQVEGGVVEDLEAVPQLGLLGAVVYGGGAEEQDDAQAKDAEADEVPGIAEAEGFFDEQDQSNEAQDEAQAM